MRAVLVMEVFRITMGVFRCNFYIRLGAVKAMDRVDGASADTAL